MVLDQKIFFNVFPYISLCKKCDPGGGAIIGRGVKFHSPACIGKVTSGSGQQNTCQAFPSGQVHFLTCEMHLSFSDDWLQLTPQRPPFSRFFLQSLTTKVRKNGGRIQTLNTAFCYCLFDLILYVPTTTYIPNIKALGLKVSDKKIFSCFRYIYKPL